MSGIIATAWKSLRTRLALWNALVVILTAAVTLVTLRQGVTWALTREIDEILIADIEEVGLMLKEFPADQLAMLEHELDRKALGHQHHGWFVELQGPGDTLVWKSNAFNPTRRQSVDPDGDDATDAAALKEQVRRNPDEIRTQRKKAPENVHGVRSILVGTQLTGVRGDLARIDELVILTASLIVAVAPVFAYWLAGRTSNVVGDITRLASRLRPDHLEERLPLRKTGDELDQLAMTINGLLDRIALFLDEKRDGLANAAHELRTPLAAIRSSVEVALNEERSVEHYQNLLEEIIDQCSSLQGLLNQLLLLSETEAERLKTQVEPVDLAGQVRRSVAMFQGVAETREIELTVLKLDAAEVAGNRFHLQQIVNNLIDNALKYSPMGSKVEVSLVRENDKGTVTFTVRDNGEGIPAEDRPMIFNRFFRVKRSRSRLDSPAGTGLGLAICKAVAEAHHGRIRCESEEGVGSAFIVELPLHGTIVMLDSDSQRTLATQTAEK